MTDGTLLGIDVGTTAVKAGIVAPDGSVVDAIAQAYPTRRDGPAIAEQDPADWVRCVTRAIARFAAAGYRPAAIGLCSQVNTHVFVDAAGRPLMPAILWQDTRAAAEAAEIDARVTPAQKLAWWGAPLPIDASHVLPRMLWCARNRPEVWAATRHVLLPKDHVIAALTGEICTDPLSNIGLVDAAGAYIPAALDLVPGAAARLAPLLGLTTRAGRLRAGPMAGVPVACGTMDAWAGLVGAGGARDGTTVYLGGTSEILGISARTVVPTPGIVVFAPEGGIRLHAAPTQSGGDALRWFADATGVDPDAVLARAATTAPGGATPLFLPQIEGERAPLWDAALRGAFLGLTRRTGYGHLARAVLEGVALSARHALEALQLSAAVTSPAIRCGGGGFRAALWTQIRADVLGRELHLLTRGDPGVLGAAMIAAVTAGRHASIAEVSEVTPPIRIVAPDAAAHRRYDALYDIYREAIAGNAALTRRLTGIAGADDNRQTHTAPGDHIGAP